ncbi:MAG: aldo/keto reductase [Chitinivibrionales bacterium]|nr:aldo/keto reductase [Chitinivibrionales bacterium]
MEHTTFGTPPITISRLCLGCWQASGWATSDDTRFIRTVEHALDQGVNFLDTAAAYGNGHSEELVAKAIKGKRDKVVIATKFTHTMSRPDKIRRSLEQSLRLLNTDYIDLFQQHWPPKNVPLADTINELIKLKDEGKIRTIGVSNWMEPEWEEFDGDLSVIDSLQPCYSLLWRSVEKNILALCKKHSIAIFTYSPLAQGILAGRFRSIDDRPKSNDPRAYNRLFDKDRFPQVLTVVDCLEEIATKHNKSLSQTALRWLLDREGVTSVIAGASRPEQVEENCGTVGWSLDPEDREKLDTVSRPLSEDLKPHDTIFGWHSRG